MFSDFQLMKVLHHGVMKDRNVFQELTVRNSDVVHRAVAHLSRRQRTVDGDQEMLMPDPHDKNTVLRLADMSLNAYENRNSSGDWIPVPGFNVVRQMLSRRKIHLSSAGFCL